MPHDEPGLLFMELSRKVEARVPRYLFENAAVRWYTTTVKLDLQGRGLINRVPGSSSQRLVRGKADVGATR